ncbi:MAG: KEOPS complex subunit Cgi121 [Thermoplasmatota archaeon]
MNDDPDNQVAWAAARGPAKLADVLFTAKKVNRLAPTQVVRADRVLGDAHVRSAALHAHRAFAEGRNQADRLEVEFTRYLAGERQIKRAIAKMGLPDVADALVVVALGEKRTDAVQLFLHQLGLVEDDALADATPEKLADWGFTSEQFAATTPKVHGDLVLEAVAAVDLMK